MSDLNGFSNEELEQALRRKREAELAAVPTSELQAALAAQKPEKPLHTKFLDTVRGNAAENLPSIYGNEFTAQNRKAGASAFRPAMAAVFGSDTDVANALRQEHPGASIGGDANGNEVIQMPDGQRFYVNQPGLDLTDVGRFAGKVMQFIPAGRAASLPMSLGGRMAVGALASGATDIAGQALAGRSPSKMDPQQVALTTALGAGTELVMPLVSGAGRQLRSALTSPAREVERGRLLAGQYGLTDVSDDAARALARRQGEIAAGADPRAVVAESEFGYRLTRGQITGNEDLLRREELLRSINPSGPLGALDRANAEATRMNIERFRNMAARSGSPEVFEQDASQRIRDSLSAAREQAQRQVADAYGRVPKASAFASSDDVTRLPSRLDDALRQGDVALSESLTPNTMTARRVLEQAATSNAGGPMRMDRLMDLRKIIGRLGTDAKREDSRAFRVLMKEFDGWFDESLTRSLSGSGDEAVRAFREATATARDYFRKFEDGKSEGGKAIIRMLSEEATPEQVANVLLNAQGINKPGAAAMARRYIDAVGRESDGVTALREIVAMRLFEKAGDPKSNAAILASLKEATAGRGRSLMTTMFNRTELAMMQRFARALDEFIVPKGMLARSSGTAERLAAYLAPFGHLPLVHTMRGIFRGLQAQASTRELIPSGPYVIPAAAAASATSLREEDQSRGGQRPY